MNREQIPDPAEPGRIQGYEIRLLGALDQRWSDWFQGIELTITYTPDQIPITMISCPSTDQAQLRGMLNKLWDLNLSLISVSQIDPKGSAGSRMQKHDPDWPVSG